MGNSAYSKALVTICLGLSYLFQAFIFISMPYNTIDLANDTPFMAKEWIGVGKKYTLDVPQAVANAKNDQLHIPEFFAAEAGNEDI